jgi:hypothetical protein
MEVVPPVVIVAVGIMGVPLGSRLAGRFQRRPLQFVVQLVAVEIGVVQVIAVKVVVRQIAVGSVAVRRVPVGRRRLGPPLARFAAFAPSFAAFTALVAPAASASTTPAASTPSTSFTLFRCVAGRRHRARLVGRSFVPDVVFHSVVEPFVAPPATRRDVVEIAIHIVSQIPFHPPGSVVEIDVLVGLAPGESAPRIAPWLIPTVFVGPPRLGPPVFLSAIVGAPSAAPAASSAPTPPPPASPVTSFAASTAAARRRSVFAVTELPWIDIARIDIACLDIRSVAVFRAARARFAAATFGLARLKFTSIDVARLGAPFPPAALVVPASLVGLAALFKRALFKRSLFGWPAAASFTAAFFTAPFFLAPFFPAYFFPPSLFAARRTTFAMPAATTFFPPTPIIATPHLAAPFVAARRFFLAPSLDCPLVGPSRLDPGTPGCFVAGCFIAVPPFVAPRYRRHRVKRGGLPGRRRARRARRFDDRRSGSYRGRFGASPLRAPQAQPAGELIPARSLRLGRFGGRRRCFNGRRSCGGRSRLRPRGSLRHRMLVGSQFVSQRVPGTRLLLVSGHLFPSVGSCLPLMAIRRAPKSGLRGRIGWRPSEYAGATSVPTPY